MGWIYDQRGVQVLLVVPIADSAAALAFADSTVKAMVSELVDRDTRALAFGWLAFVRGLGLLVSGAMLGIAYDQSISLTIRLIVVINAIALAGLVSVFPASVVAS